MVHFTKSFFVIPSLGLFLQAVQAIAVDPDLWANLNQAVEGRLFEGAPLAQPCSKANFTASECANVQKNYVDPAFRTGNPGSTVNSNWETCQTTGEQCLLDPSNPSDLTPLNGGCALGSVSQYYINVKTGEDVTAAFEFSKKTKVPIVIKNTGHDYAGRANAPGSLGLWTHNLDSLSYNAEFVPEGCQEKFSAITIGAGAQWKAVYEFAESQNVTVVGGAHSTVGAVGGWLQGGGHSLLSNTMGLGVDRVLQYKIVTPDGKLRVANACQNDDLFFALRGGGGGTFGVVLDATILATPLVTIQSVIVAFGAKPALTKELWSIMVENAPQFVADGWGAMSRANVAVYVNPKLSKADAATSLAPIISFGERLKAENVTGATLAISEFPTFGSYFQFFAARFGSSSGISLALTSRLLPKSSFEEAASRSALTDALFTAETATPGATLMMTTPASFPGDGKTSVTEAWRSSLFHVTLIKTWNWSATPAEKRQHFQAASSSIDNLRKITPDAAYVNEADVYEPNFEKSFWGTNYVRLLEIKNKYDPDRLLDCWHCVGWDPKSPRFSCYLP